MSERFYYNGDGQEGDLVKIEGAEHHHLAHVVKIRVGEQVELLNGKGSRAAAKVVSIDKKSARLELVQVERTPIPPPRFVLGIPMMRPSKLEWVVEKGTELGADAFWIYLAEHSEKETLSEHQLERLSYIAISAMKQCGRSDLPPIAQFPHLKALLTHSPLPCLFGDVRPAAKPMREVLVDKALFITGPERGFSQGEVKILEEKGTGVHLHKNILRAETAPLAAISMLWLVK